MRIEAQYEHGEGLTVSLARYAKGGPLPQERTLRMHDGQVLMPYTDHRDKKARTLRLPTVQFIERVLWHAPPRGVHTTRHAGLYSTPYREQHALIAAMLNTSARARRRPKPRPELTKEAPSAAAACPNCGAPLQRMLLIRPLLRRRFNGRRWPLVDEAAHLRAEAQAARSATQGEQRRAEHAEARLADAQRQVAQLADQLDTSSALATAREADLTVARDRIETQQREAEDLRRRQAELALDVRQLTQERLGLQRELGESRQQFQQLADHLRWIENSTVFRATRPLVRAKMALDRLLGRAATPQPAPLPPAEHRIEPTEATVDMIVPVYRELAKQTGLTVTTVNKLELGYKAPRIESLLLLASAFACDPTELLHRAKQKGGAKAELLDELNALATQLSPKQIRELVKSARGMEPG